MRTIRTMGAALCFAMILAWPALAEEAVPAPPAYDDAEQTVEELRAEVAELKDRLNDLEEKLAELITAPAPDTAAPSSQPSSNALNPDIGVNAIASIQFPTDELGDAAIDFEELELSIAGVVDPYASYFAALVFEGEAVEVEEAYATLTNFPADLTTSFGRRLLPVGLWNPLHRHAWPMNNGPLVLQEFLGDPHAIGTGISSEYTWGESPTFTATAGVATEMEGQFTQKGLEHPLLHGRLQGFWDSPGDGLQLGANVVHGAVNEEGTLGATLIGLDAKWRGGSAQDYDKTLVQAEAWWGERDGLLNDFDAFGWYLLGERQLARDWTVGARVEATESLTGMESTDRFSLYANWARTEFYRWRLQYDLANGDDDNISLQALFTLGPHPAHPF